MEWDETKRLEKREGWQAPERHMTEGDFLEPHTMAISGPIVAQQPTGGLCWFPGVSRLPLVAEVSFMPHIDDQTGL